MAYLRPSDIGAVDLGHFVFVKLREIINGFRKGGCGKYKSPGSPVLGARSEEIYPEKCHIRHENWTSH